MIILDLLILKETVSAHIIQTTMIGSFRICITKGVREIIPMSAKSIKPLVVYVFADTQQRIIEFKLNIIGILA